MKKFIWHVRSMARYIDVNKCVNKKPGLERDRVEQKKIYSKEISCWISLTVPSGGSFFKVIR